MKKNISVFLFIVLFFLVSLVHAQPAAVLVKKIGMFGDGPGQLKFPAMIAIDRDNNFYVVDQHNHRIQKFDHEGNFILMWGKFGTGPGEFNFPYGIAVDSKRNVYVTDMNNNRIQKFNSNGEFINAAGSYGISDKQFKYPYGIAVGQNDVLYVVDAFNYCIKEFTPDLVFISKWGSPDSIGIKLYMPHEIAVTSEGNIILSDRQNHRLSVFNQSGKLVKRIGEYGEGPDAVGGKFSEPHGLAIAANGDIFVCDRYNFRIQKLNAGGQPQMQWLASADFADDKYFPLGVAVNKDGNVFVTDHYNHCILQYKLFTDNK